MHARSAVFDLYGDHLHARDGWAPIAGAVRLLGALEVSPPAVRTAVSRLVREGWLASQTRDGQRGYRTTPRAIERLDAARRRIYRTRPPAEEDWHLVVLERPAARAARERLAAAMTYLGYARLAPLTWLAPRPSEELASLLSTEGVRATTMQVLPGSDAHQLAGSLWDLDGLGRQYQSFLGRVGAQGTPPVWDTREAYRRRSELVHAWRTFLFLDPGLPPHVLPADWPGTRAAAEFDRLAAVLLPAARRYVDDVLQDCAGQTGPRRPANIRSTDPERTPEPRGRR